MRFKSVAVSLCLIISLVGAGKIFAISDAKDANVPSKKENSVVDQKAEFNEFLDLFYGYLKNSKKKDSEKVVDVIKGLGIIEKQGNFFQLRNAVHASDALLFKDYKDSEVTQDQLMFLYPLSVDRERWVFARKYEDVFNFVNKLAVSSKDTNLLVALYWNKANWYAENGRFVLADKELDSARKLISQSKEIPKVMPGLDRALLFITNSMQLRYLMDRGDLNSVIKVYPSLEAESKWFLNDFAVSHKNFVHLAAPGFTLFMRVDLVLGNFQHAIDLGDKLIALTGGDKLSDPNLLQKRAVLYQLMSTAYKKLGKDKLAEEYEQKSVQANFANGQASMAQLWGMFFQAINYQEYGDAKEILAIIKKSSQDTSYKDSDAELYYDLNIYNQMIAFVDEVQASKFDLNVIKKHYKNLGVFMEATIPDLQASGNKNALIDYYNSLYVIYEFSGDKQVAALYAKQYVNLLQELRFSIGKNSEQLEIFTQGHSDNLKKYVDTFIEIGDVDSARSTLKIIKQNEFIDYLKQRGATNMVATKLSIPPAQEAVLRRIDLRSLEVTALKAKINQFDKQDPKNKALLNELVVAIKKKNQEISQLRLELKDLARKDLQKDGLMAARGSINIKRKNEALIDFYVQSNSVSLIITTDRGSKTYVNQVDRIQLRKNLLDLYSSISNPKKTKVDLALISKISDELMISKIFELKEQGVKSLKIRTDDLVAIAPLAILPAGSSDLGSTFNIQIQGLGDGQQSGGSSKALKAFGVTKGYKEFPALPLVRDEVEYISDIASGGGKKSSFIDNEFTKGTLLDAFNNGTSTIHIASHYSPKKSAGSNGRLLLGDGSTISIEELNSKIQPKISTSLVTLSACDTGLSTSNDGMSNLEGLSNVFNVKGVKHVLGTLWEVSDESTADFMRLYYLLTIKNGLDPDEALSVTQRVFRAGNLSPIPSGIQLPNDPFISGLKNRLPGYSHPFYWAPFQILAI